MDRRGFLGSILAMAAAPAIVRADLLMRIIPRAALILPPVEILRYGAQEEFGYWASCFVRTTAGGRVGWTRVGKYFGPGEEVVLTLPRGLQPAPADGVITSPIGSPMTGWRWGAQVETTRPPDYIRSYASNDYVVPNDALAEMTR